jgi:hypothetical protein
MALKEAAAVSIVRTVVISIDLTAISIDLTAILIGEIVTTIGITTIVGHIMQERMKGVATAAIPMSNQMRILIS